MNVRVRLDRSDSLLRGDFLLLVDAEGVSTLSPRNEAMETLAALSLSGLDLSVANNTIGESCHRPVLDGFRHALIFFFFDCFCSCLSFDVPHFSIFLFGFT